MTNTVAYSAGAVCCPDERSARTRDTRATWIEPARLFEYATPGMPSALTLMWVPTVRWWTS